ncbi:MAG: metallophosphoesterase [Candidatus Hydrogenedentes bacterium]|nr:metallophosphoesterase [Candidatus Hydrogenedentota bacterium]
MDAGNGPYPWNHLNLRDAASTFRFAIIADRTGAERTGVFADAIRKLDLLQPDFVMSIGDLIQGRNEDLVEVKRQREELLAMVNPLDMPFFHVAGNHDISNPAMAEEWKQRFGPTYYNFEYKNVLFLCLNTQDAEQGHFSDAQIAYAQRVLAENQQVTWTLVFLHQPVWTYDPATTRWDRIEALLGDRPYSVFAGHEHVYMKSVRNGRTYIVMSTTGGGSDMRGLHWGEFDHLAWVTMTDEGPVMANLMVDGIHGDDIVTEELSKLTAPLREGAAVRSEVSTIDPGTATARVQLSNPAELPMQITAAVQAGPEWNASPMNVQEEIPPHSTETVVVNLERAGQYPTQTAPVPVTWTAVYAPPDARPVKVEGVHRIIVDAPFDVARTTNPVTLDGKLDEWPDLPHDVREPGQVLEAWQTWHGPADCSYRFGVAYDDDFVYVAMRTIDETRVAVANRRVDKQDGIMLHFDLRPAEARTAEASNAQSILTIAMGPGETPDATIIANPYPLPEGVRAVCVTTPEGHATEIAIPVQYLQKAQGGEWSGFRLNLAAYDSDGFPTDAHTHVWWRPRWDTPENYEGSGTFVRR